MEWDGVPERMVPNGTLGPTTRFRKQEINVSCQGRYRGIGWLLFGKDGSLYFHPRGKSPVIQSGEAVEKDGQLVMLNSIDLMGIPEEDRTGIHLSLHPSGQVHVKGGTGRKIAVANIGLWIPVIRPFVFTHVFTAPVGNLPEVQTVGPAIDFGDPGKSLRIDLVVSPLNEMGGYSHVPQYRSTVCIGFSPRYAVLVNATAVAPCEPIFFFLSSAQSPPGS